MFKKVVFVLLTIFLGIFISGCIRTEPETQSITFFKYVMKIPKSWQEVDPSLISIKQLEKKIKLAYENLDKNQKENLAISYTQIKDNFYKENDVIQAVLAKYKSLEDYKLEDIYSIDINCNGKTQKLYIHKFTLETTDKDNTKKAYYFVQGYLFYNNLLITISFLTQNLEKIPEYENYIKFLTCKQ